MHYKMQYYFVYNIYIMYFSVLVNNFQMFIKQKRHPFQDTSLQQIKNYQFSIFSYIEDLAEYNKIFKNTLSVDYDLIFSKLYEIFRLYIKVAKMEYSFVLPIPDSNSNISELHQKTEKIIFDIEKEMRSRYRNRNSWW